MGLPWPSCKPGDARPPATTRSPAEQLQHHGHLREAGGGLRGCPVRVPLSAAPLPGQAVGLGVESRVSLLWHCPGSPLQSSLSVSRWPRATLYTFKYTHTPSFESQDLPPYQPLSDPRVGTLQYAQSSCLWRQTQPCLTEMHAGLLQEGRTCQRWGSDSGHQEITRALVRSSLARPHHRWPDSALSFSGSARFFLSFFFLFLLPPLILSCTSIAQTHTVGIIRLCM